MQRHRCHNETGNWFDAAASEYSTNAQSQRFPYSSRRCRLSFSLRALHVYGLLARAMWQSVNHNVHTYVFVYSNGIWSGAEDRYDSTDFYRTYRIWIFARAYVCFDVVNIAASWAGLFDKTRRWIWIVGSLKFAFFFGLKQRQIEEHSTCNTIPLECDLECLMKSLLLSNDSPHWAHKCDTGSRATASVTFVDLAFLGVSDFWRFGFGCSFGFEIATGLFLLELRLSGETSVGIGGKSLISISGVLLEGLSAPKLCQSSRSSDSTFISVVGSNGSFPIWSLPVFDRNSSIHCLDLKQRLRNSYTNWRSLKQSKHIRSGDSSSIYKIEK